MAYQTPPYSMPRLVCSLVLNPRAWKENTNMIGTTSCWKVITDLLNDMRAVIDKRFVSACGHFVSQYVRSIGSAFSLHLSPVWKSAMHSDKNNVECILAVRGNSSWSGSVNSVAQNDNCTSWSQHPVSITYGAAEQSAFQRKENGFKTGELSKCDTNAHTFGSCLLTTAHGKRF